MKILLASGNPYLPALSGAFKANRAIAEGLAARGHEVRVVGLARTAIRPGATAEQLTALLAARGIVPTVEGDVHRYTLAGVEVHAIADGFRIRDHVAAQLHAWAPDAVLLSSEDFRQNLLEATLAAGGKVVYLAHTTTSLPVGPFSVAASAGGAALLARVAAILAPSRYVADYVARWAGREATLFHFPVYGAGPFPALGRFDGELVTLVNPCEVKGLSIFLALARALPDVAFGAVPTWGATDGDLAALAAQPNVRVLPPDEDIDALFARTRVLLVPSLWQEAFGLVVVEAMLRGIPVLASDVGGLPEAKLGTDLVLPVRPIERYAIRRGMLVPDAPVAQDVGPWLDALRGLVEDPAVYAKHAAAARAAATRFAAGLSLDPLERALRAIAP